MEITAWLLNLSHSILIPFPYNMGTVTICIYDNYGSLVNCIVEDASIEDVIIIPAPTISGLYYLQIQSTVYCGKGMFSV